MVYLYGAEQTRYVCVPTTNSISPSISAVDGPRRRDGFKHDLLAQTLYSGRNPVIQTVENPQGSQGRRLERTATDDTLTPIEEMNGPHIRQATPQDAERLVDVYRSAYRENRELGFPAKAETATVEDIHEWLDGGRLYVAEIEQQVIGAVRIEETTPERLKISRFGVHDDWQGQGVGTVLLDHVEHLARAEDVESVWLTAPEDHPYLPALYRDRGYTKTEDYPLEYREYDEVVMEKPLDEI